MRMHHLLPAAAASLLLAVPSAALAATDHDHDRLPDRWEVRHGLSPHDARDGGRDNDRDGLSNRSELHNRCHPRRSDTRGDGPGDGLEVRAGRDPLNPFDDYPFGDVMPPVLPGSGGEPRHEAELRHGAGEVEVEHGVTTVGPRGGRL